MERAGKAEELSKHESMLLAAQTGLDKARANAKATNYVSSTAINHTDTLYKAVSLVGGQFVTQVTTGEREATNTGIMGVSSIAFLLLAPIFYFSAGLNRRPGVLDEWIHGAKEEPTRVTYADGKSSSADIHNHVVISDEVAMAKLRKTLGEMASKIQLPAPQFGAAA